MVTSSKPRRFLIHRIEDESGVSGTGMVAEGVMFTDGRVAMRWRSNHASVAVFDKIEDVEHVHGHGGKTKIVWIDPIEPVKPKREYPDPQAHDNHVHVNIDTDKMAEYVIHRLRKIWTAEAEAARPHR